MWWFTVALLVVAYVLLSLRFGPQRGIGFAVPIAMSLPAWLLLGFFDGPSGSIVGTGIDGKVAVASAALLLYCFLPGRTFPSRLVPCDFLIAGLILVHLSSDWINSGFSWLSIGRACAEWYVPYLAGRLAFQRLEDLLPLAYTLGTLAVALGLLAAIEAFSGINLMETCFGSRPIEGFSRTASRWGIKRAFGPTLHPIYLGGLLLFFSAAAMVLASLAFKNRANPGWVFAPLFAVAGIVCTGSRGPIVALVFSVLMWVFFVKQKMRILMLGIAAASFVPMIVFRQPLVERLEDWSGESRSIHKSAISIGDENKEYTGTRNRLLLLEVYSIALRRSGLLGFGTDAVSGFPINVPAGDRAAATLKKVRYIDNAYVLITLRFGWIGLGLFILVGLVAWGQLLFVYSRAVSQRRQVWAASLGASLSGMLLLLFTVWMPHEIGFPLVWLYGASSGMLIDCLSMPQLKS